MGASGDYYSTDNTGATISKVVQTNITQKPANGVRYRWTNVTGLPIELVSFDGKFEGNQAMLEWNTASEKNNQFFYVERSADGLKFETVGQVKGVGNSAIGSHYNFIDSPLDPSQNEFYYRLRQTDYDNRTSYSPVIRVGTMAAENAPKIYFDNASNSINIAYNFTDVQNLHLEIVDLVGRVIYRRGLGMVNGKNSVVVDLPPDIEGIYIARLRGEPGDIATQVKFIKN
jgi:hypothetical protein